MPPFCLKGPRNMADAPENNNLPSQRPSNSVGLLPQTFPLENSLPQLLMSQSGVNAEEELTNCVSLRLRVVARDMSLQRLSIYTPALRQLDLSGSCLTSLRDLGCRLRLESLRVRRCGLDCLDGASGLSSLRTLDASHNAIRDIGPCAMLPHIRSIDLTSNAVADLSQMGFLSLCGELRHLTLSGCPLASLQHVADYRQHVVDLLPQLQSLDGQPLPVDGIANRNSKEAKEEEKEEEEDSDVDVESKTVDKDDEKQKEDVGKIKIKKQAGPRQATRPSTSTGLRPTSSSPPQTAAIRPQSAGHADTTGVMATVGEGGEGGGTSRLTSGVIVCGNLTAALKKRNRKPQKNAWTVASSPQQAVNNGVLCDIEETSDERSKDIKTLLTASKNWRTAFTQYRQLNGDKWKAQETADSDQLQLKDTDLKEN